MKLESLPDLYIVLAALVPGFIYNGVLTSFVPLRQNKERVVLTLRFLTITAVNYAVSSPLIYLLMAGDHTVGTPALRALAWFAIIFMVPVVLATIHAEIVQHDGFGWLYRLLRLRAINPIPTGWDWVFSRAEPCYVLVTLTDGTQVAGYFGARSMASSDPERKDIFLEEAYTVPDDGTPWEAVAESLGVYIEGSQISSIEFRRGDP